MRSLARTLLLLLSAILPYQAMAQQEPVARVETPREARAQDAAEYAKLFDVPQDEAVRRLDALDDSVAETDRLAEKYRARLAGIWIAHSPVFEIVVALTGSDPVADRRLHLDGLDVPIVFKTGALATRERVIWAMTYHQNAIRAVFDHPPAMGVDPRTGELIIIIGSEKAAEADALKAKVEAVAGVPVRMIVLDNVDVNLSPVGGSRLVGVSPDDGKRYLCTTGFTVTDGSRYGVTTAAHCLDNMSYYDPQRVETPLEYAGQWGWGYRDVQINLARQPLDPLIYSDSKRTMLRPITASRPRQSLRSGDFVCHRGERTGYSCAVVQLTDFAPAGDLCGGACLPTWVTVSGPTCKGGDSGAPVFSGTTALGILKGASYRRGGKCAFYFFMSLDYLPPGWSLVQAPADGWVPPPDRRIGPWD